MVRASFLAKVPAKKLQAATTDLRAILEPVRVEPGCLGCHLLRDLEDANVLLLVQEWETRADLTRHLRSERARTLLLILEAAGKPPEISFDTISERDGIEVIQEACR